VKAPSKAVAAQFLRAFADKIAAHPGKPLKDPAQLAVDLRLVANCIEGRLRWTKGGKRTYAQTMRMGMAVSEIENRPSTVLVKAAVSRQVEVLCREWQLTTEAQRKEIRGEIEAMRKRRRSEI
jgi:hypothetical protein